MAKTFPTDALDPIPIHRTWHIALGNRHTEPRGITLCMPCQHREGIIGDPAGLAENAPVFSRTQQAGTLGKAMAHR